MSDRTTERDATAQALHSLATLAERHISHVEGAAITLLERNGPHLGASNDLAREVDLVQYGCNEGPCISAVEQGVPMTSGRIGRGEKRWPRFVQGSAPIGLRSVLSFPLLGTEHVEGSLNLYARASHAFDAVSILQAERFVHPLAVAIRNARVLSAIDAVAATMTRLLDDRAVVDVALGVLCSREGLDVVAARRRLDELARAESRPLVDTARALVPRTPPRPPGPGSPG